MNYFDHSASTPIHPEVMALMNSIQLNIFGNSSSIHFSGQKSRALIENSRQQVAKSINAEKEQIIFTSGGTESNNQVLWSTIHNKKNHLITSKIEHPAIIKVIQSLNGLGTDFSLVGVNSNGIISISEIEQAITKDTNLISIMLANNEIGTIQSLKSISEIAHQKGILVHTDAVQCLGKMNLDVLDLELDFLSLSAHKFYGPKGVGALFAKDYKSLSPLLIGGPQEKGLRGGTENHVSIAGMGLAAELATLNLEDHVKHLKQLEKQFKMGLKNISDEIVFNGDQVSKLPGLISVSFPGHNSTNLLTKLDRAKIYVSNGAACGSGDVKPSPVLSAMGYDNSLNLSTLRFSFGSTNTSEEIENLLFELNRILNEWNALQ